MSEHLTRRQLLVRGVALAAGTAALDLIRPTVTLAQEPARSEDLVDGGDGFARGSLQNVVADETGLRPTADRGTYTSVILWSRVELSHVGLHWLADVPPGTRLTFELRASPDGAGWSPWLEAHLERLPDETPTREYFAGLLFTGPARAVQYRATFTTAGGQSPRLQRVTATVIDAPTAFGAANVGAASPTVTVTDADCGRALAVTAREQWGADEHLRFAGGQKLWPEMFVPAAKLVVHHTATRNSYASPAEAMAEIRAVYHYHAVTQAWGDIGYHALIDRFGNVYEGRHGRGEGPATAATPSREVLSKDVVAGHALHHNYGSVGVALLGDATQPDWPMLGAGGPMWDALVRYGVFEAGRHFIRLVSPDGTTAAGAFLRSDDLWAENLANVSGHRETFNTVCPGDRVMALLPALRSAIQADLRKVSRSGVQLVPTPSREARIGTPLTLAWAPERPKLGWTVVGYEYCVEGWAMSRADDSIRYLDGFTPEVQPRPIWIPLDARTTASFTPTAAGHYTLHVRAILRNERKQVLRRGAFERAHTYLVR